MPWSGQGMCVVRFAAADPERGRSRECQSADGVDGLTPSFAGAFQGGKRMC